MQEHTTVALTISSVASPKYWEVPNVLTLSEQQHFVSDTASQSTKRQVMLEIWGEWTPCPAASPSLRLCDDFNSRVSCSTISENAGRSR